MIPLPQEAINGRPQRGQPQEAVNGRPQRGQPQEAINSRRNEPTKSLELADATRPWALL